MRWDGKLWDGRLWDRNWDGKLWDRKWDGKMVSCETENDHLNHLIYHLPSHLFISNLRSLDEIFYEKNEKNEMMVDCEMMMMIDHYVISSFFSFLMMKNLKLMNFYKFEMKMRWLLFFHILPSTIIFSSSSHHLISSTISSHLSDLLVDLTWFSKDESDISSDERSELLEEKRERW